MNVIRCKSGHFFDGDSYDKCPHCGESPIISGENPSSIKEEKKNFWGRGKKEKEDIASRMNTTPSEISRRDFGNGASPTEVNGSSSLTANSTPSLKKNPTLDFWQTSSHSRSESGKSRNEQEEANFSASDKETFAYTMDEEVAGRQPEIEREDWREEVRETAPEPPSLLREAVKNASASNEGKTMSYFSSATAPSSNQSQSKQPVEPVVGWLVCVKGYHFGECFSVFAGKNSIGRSSENRIIIAGDNGISRVKHALIVYEPKKRNFYLQPGDSSGLTYLNDNYITESHKLSSYNMIEIGDSKFMFVPLCGEEFSWEDYSPKGE